MLTHERIWQAIDKLANMSGYSTSGLAKQAGLDPTAFNKSKRISPEGKARWPSTESIAKILAVTGTTMSDFLALIDEQDNIGSRSAPQPTIPIIGCAQAGAEGYFDDAGYPAGNGWDEVNFPGLSSQNGEHVYALEVSGESMEPLYRGGDILVVDPGAQLRKGDRVVVRTRSGEVMAKELIRKTATRADLRSLNPDHEIRSVDLGDMDWMARILWVSQ